MNEKLEKFILYDTARKAVELNVSLVRCGLLDESLMMLTIFKKLQEKGVDLERLL